jgi:hypothetical protein
MTRRYPPLALHVIYIRVGLSVEGAQRVMMLCLIELDGLWDSLFVALPLVVQAQALLLLHRNDFCIRQY